MAGGTWIDQNRVRPGVYINYKSAPSSLATMGERGIVAIARVLDWGERGKFYTISDPSDCEQFGHSITDAECLFIRQILLGTNRTQGASKILLWSLETPTTSAKASKQIGTGDAWIQIEAKSAGADGNKISFLWTANTSTYTFTLKYDGEVVGSVETSGGSNISFSGINTAMTDAMKALVTVTGYGAIQGGQEEVYLSGGVSSSVKAAATIGNLVATAKYYGTLGNRLSVVITAGVNSDFIVQTLLDGQAVDSQTVAAISGLVANDYIVWSGAGALATNAGVSLTGGANGEAGTTQYSDFLSALEVEKFDVVIYDGTDATTKSAFTNFVKSLTNDEGVKCQAVMSDYASADSECVISVYPQSVTLVDGTTLTAPQLTWWVGGATAGAKQNESLTYAAYPDAASMTPLLTSSQQVSAIQSGNFALVAQYDKIQALTDINSFQSVRVEKGQAFKKNRVIRTLFGICNDVQQSFSQYYIGAVDNDDEGRKSLKAEVLNILNRYQGIRAIQNVVVDDVTVMKGTDSDAVVIEIYVQPVDSVEKIYINITIS